MADHMTAETIRGELFAVADQLSSLSTRQNEVYQSVHGAELLRLAVRTRELAARLSGMAAVPDQPIATAPTDRDVLLYSPLRGWFRGFWHQGCREYPAGGFVGRYMMPGLTLDTFRQREGAAATHWRELPAAPEPPHV